MAERTVRSDTSSTIFARDNGMNIETVFTVWTFGELPSVGVSLILSDKGKHGITSTTNDNNKQ